MKKFLIPIVIIVAGVLLCLFIGKESKELKRNESPMVEEGFRISIEDMSCVKIYSVSLENGADYTDEELLGLEKKTIDNPGEYFGEIIFQDEMVLWKGDNLGIIFMKNGEKHRIRMSTYGEFFSVIGEKGYYTYQKK